MPAKTTVHGFTTWMSFIEKLQANGVKTVYLKQYKLIGPEIHYCVVATAQAQSNILVCRFKVVHLYPLSTITEEKTAIHYTLVVRELLKTDLDKRGYTTVSGPIPGFGSEAFMPYASLVSLLNPTQEMIPC